MRLGDFAVMRFRDCSFIPVMPYDAYGESLSCSPCALSALTEPLSCKVSAQGLSVVTLFGCRPERSTGSKIVVENKVEHRQKIWIPSNARNDRKVFGNDKEVARSSMTKA